MSYLTRIQRKLDERFGARVRAEERDGCLFLTGELDCWEDVVTAGRMAVNKRRYDGLVNKIRMRGADIPPMRTPPVQDDSLEGNSPDVLIIGGGVVGCAIARELARYDISILLCEKEHDVAMQASSRNDGMVHPGIDLLPGQCKRKYNMRGNRMYDALTAELDVPFRRPGQYLCMGTRMLSIVAFFAQLYFRIVGVPVRFMTRRALLCREPRVSENVRCALFFPTAGVVSPYGLTIALMENAVDNGATLALDTAVLGMEVQDGRIQSVRTNRGTVYPKIVVNAAGVFSDEVAAMAEDQFFSIHPRRGTNSILDEKAAYQVNTIVSAYGTSSTHKRHTKGGGVVRTVDGNVLVGPDARETFDREDFSTSAESVAATFRKQRAIDPLLSERDIITYFTGVRAATYEEDFVIRKGRRTRNIVHAAGIQSPGLTAAPAIAEDVARMCVELLGGDDAIPKRASFDPTHTSIPRVKELSQEVRDALIRRDPDYGEIVCRCEEISRGEIRDALRRSVPCDTVDGVKRRVRPGMGRCQGGFCGPLVLQIIAREKNAPLERVTKNGMGSEVLVGKTKEGGSDGSI